MLELVRQRCLRGDVQVDPRPDGRSFLSMEMPVDTPVEGLALRIPHTLMASWTLVSFLGHQLLLTVV